ncbi:hypothetical protein Axy09_008 [Achromobacter phage vB_AxyP_19-32_Axy09]|uniref:Uncharacterized protein n=1 Tax=Achromobacter phage vB_AxyP_19-32_Axy09 TaxID=2591040 RepID=A0A514CTV1_9CAUD|nr:hypothetical protein Axy09_008 [Achromobacter phage vB_AxyP_19-32_Axy09]
MTNQSNLAQNVPFLLDDTGRPVFSGQRRRLTGDYFNTGTGKHTRCEQDAGVLVYVEGTHASPALASSSRDYFTFTVGLGVKVYHHAIRVDKPESVPVLETLQDIFNMVAAQLLLVNAGRRSVNEGACLYASDSGDRCAVGGLLDGKATNVAALFGSVLNSNVKAALADVGIGLHLPNGEPNEVFDFLLAAQGLHDDGAGPLRGDGANRYRTSGRYYHLTPGRRKYFWKRTLKRWAKRNKINWLPVFDRA